MKRLLALALALILTFMLAGCSKKIDSSKKDDNQTDAITETEEFEKPQEYASVVLVTINPQLKLYLDADSKVLAIEPINDDAKSIVKQIKLEKIDFDSAIEQLITVSNQNGFVKEDAVVNFEIVESLDPEVDTQEILEAADTKTKEVAEKIDVKITVKINNTAQKPPMQSQLSSTPQSQQPPSQSGSGNSDKPPVQSKPSSSTPDQAPDSSRNEATEKPNQSVSNPNSSFEAVPSYSSVKSKNGNWNFEYASGTKFAQATLTLYGDELVCGAGFGDDIDAMTDIPPEDKEIMKKEDGTVKYNGKYYWVACGTGPVPIDSFTETGLTVTVFDTKGNSLTLKRTGENAMRIEACKGSFGDFDIAPTVGTVLTFNPS